MDMSIARMVRMMMRGITTNTSIDPIASADHFEETVKELDLRYFHCDGMGYVVDGDDDVMMVHFTPDGAEFHDHHEHPKTLQVIQCVLHTLTHMEHLQLDPVVDEESDSDEWI